MKFKSNAPCRKILVLLLVMVVATLSASLINVERADAVSMPFYNLNPCEIVLRSEFYTTYKNSSDERKNNIEVATRSLNNTLVDVGGEFSFNRCVGERTTARGYKSAKIIFNGQFVDGVGGGVCQVSSTLYNAVLLSGLLISEYHPHSLPVSYVAPSFDAMVNSGSADLKFYNNTDNPIIITATSDGERLTVKIYGQPLKEKYLRKSVVTGEIPPEKEREILDEKGEYPELLEGQSKFISYSKAGLTSEGYVIALRDGKVLSITKIRADKYNALRGVVIKGTKKPEQKEEVDSVE